MKPIMGTAATVTAILALLTLVSPSALDAQPTDVDVFAAQAIVNFDERRSDQALENLSRAWLASRSTQYPTQS